MDHMAKQDLVESMLTLMGFRCPHCHGTGEIIREWTDGYGHPCEYEITCEDCDGEGYLCES